MRTEYDDGYELGYSEGFTDGYDKAADNTKTQMEYHHAEHIGSLTDAFSSKIEVLNSQICDLRKELFELRIAHAATTRTIPERTG